MKKVNSFETLISERNRTNETCENCGKTNYTLQPDFHCMVILSVYEVENKNTVLCQLCSLPEPAEEIKKPYCIQLSLF